MTPSSFVHILTLLLREMFICVWVGLLSSHLAASLTVRPGGSADLEALCAGFAQPAVR